MTDIEDDIDEGPKYIVFKREDWDTWAQTSDELRRWMAQAALEDATVIRLKDPFAAPALFGYCNTIMTTLELLEGHITDVEYQRMLNIADYFHNQAMASEKIKGKRLPD